MRLKSNFLTPTLGIIISFLFVFSCRNIDCPSPDDLWVSSYASTTIDSTEIEWTWSDVPQADFYRFQLERLSIAGSGSLLLDTVQVDTSINVPLPNLRVQDTLVASVTSLCGDNKPDEPRKDTIIFGNAVAVDDIVMGLQNSQTQNLDCMCKETHHCTHIRLMEPQGIFTDPELQSLNQMPYPYSFFKKAELCPCMEGLKGKNPSLNDKELLLRCVEQIVPLLSSDEKVACRECR